MTKEQLLARLTRAVAEKEAAQDRLHQAILAATDGGCSLAEIGVAMGIDRQTVRWHIAKARQAEERS